MAASRPQQDREANSCENVEARVRVTRDIRQRCVCVFTIPVLPKLKDNTALAWNVQRQRHLDTTLADAQCLPNLLAGIIIHQSPAETLRDPA